MNQGDSNRIDQLIKIGPFFSTSSCITFKQLTLTNTWTQYGYENQTCLS